MFCAISGKVPEHPVVSIKSGNVYEKRLIEQWLDSNDNVEPTTKQQISKDDLVEVKGSKTVIPRPTNATSIPSMLQLFQNEWDAVMLESFSLKQQLENVRQELAHALYQHDAACRVIARLIKERDEARALSSNLRAQLPESASSSDSMEVETGLPEEVKSKLQSFSQDLAKERKKRQVSSSLATAENIAKYDVLSSVNLHKTTSPGISAVDLHNGNALTGGNDGDVILFNLASNKITQTLSGHSKRVTSVNFHPSHNIFVSSSTDKTVKVWSGEPGHIKLGHTIKVHTSDVTSSQIHCTDDYILSASLDKSWGFHDLHTGSTLAHVTSDAGFSSAKLHPDGLIVGTGGVDSLVKIWDLKSLKNVASFEGHSGKVVGIAFSENGYYLSTVAEDNLVKLWDLRKLKNVQTSQLPDNFNASSIKFDYSGSYVAVGGQDVRVFIGKSLTHVATLNKHSALVSDLCWGNDANTLVSVSLDRSLKTWGLK